MKVKVKPISHVIPYMRVCVCVCVFFVTPYICVCVCIFYILYTHIL